MTDLTPDSASAWSIDTVALGVALRDGAGSVHLLDMTGPAPSRTTNGLLTVPDGDDVTLTGRIEGTAEGVVVSGAARAAAHGECARCLAPLTVEVEALIREMYAYPESVTAATTGADEVPRVSDGVVDIAELVHDELVLAMPAAPLCRPDCPGLCSECGQRLADLPADHEHERIDPRWAGLRRLLPPEPPAGG